MRHGRANSKLGRRREHRTSMFRSLLTSLFRHERITTTEAKAKAVRGLADHVITLAKREDNRLHARRQALVLVPDREVVSRVFDTIAARFAERNGGYTRILKSGVRAGDAAPLVLLELVDRVEPPKDGRAGQDRKKERPTKAEKKRERKARAAAAAS